MIVFHGSNKLFDKFKKSTKRVENDFFGGGVAYFTDDQKVALTYSKAMTYRYGGEEHVYRAKLQMHNVFDVDTLYTGKNLTKFFKYIKPEEFARNASLLKAGEDKYAIMAKLELGNYQMTGKDVFRGLSKGFGQSENAQDILIKLGYDGLRYNGGDNMGVGRHNVYLPYRESAIQILNRYKVNRQKQQVHEESTIQRFSDYLQEKKEEPTGVLNVFDIDETLYNTQAKVYLKKDGEIVREITNQEYNTYKLKPGEKYDFSEFRSSKKFNETSQPIEKMFTKAKAIVAGQSEHCKTILLTARADFDDPALFLKTFRDHGFPIDQTYVHRAGNMYDKYGKSAAASKLVYLRKYLTTGKFHKVRVWDDSINNLNAITKLIQYHPNIKIETYLVKKDGSTTRHS